MLFLCFSIFVLPINSLYNINKINTILVAIFYVLLIFGLYKIISKINFENKYIVFGTLFVLIIVGVILRVSTDYIMKTVPESDFATPHAVYNLKNSGIFDAKAFSGDLSSYQIYYSMFPAWFPYMKVISFVYDVFGVNILYIKIFNWILYALTCIVLYLAGKNSFSKKSGILAVLLFTFLPSHILYSNITTPDHLSIFLISLWLLIWSKQVQYSEENNYKKLLFISILNIVCVCLINLFKPLSIFSVLVFICMEILCFRDMFVSANNKKEFVLKRLIYSFCFILFCAFSIKIENKVLNTVVENNINTKVVDSTGLYMLWGYSVNETGKYDSSVADRIYIDILNKNNKDTVKTIDEINNVAKQQFKANLKYLPKILLRKFYIAYYNEQGMFVWGNYSGNSDYDTSISQKYNEYFLYIANGYIFMLFVMCFMTLIKQLGKDKINKMVFASSLIIIGYTCILIFGGVQPRYKALIFGPICFLAGSSIEYRKENKDENISCNSML